MAQPKGNGLGAQLSAVLNSLNQKMQQGQSLPVPQSPAPPQMQSQRLQTVQQQGQSLPVPQSPAPPPPQHIQFNPAQLAALAQKLQPAQPQAGFSQQEVQEAVDKKREATRKNQLDQIASNIVNPPPPPMPPPPPKQLTGMAGWAKMAANLGHSFSVGRPEQADPSDMIRGGKERGGVLGGLQQAGGRFLRAMEDPAKLNPLRGAVGGAAGDALGKAVAGANVVGGVFALGKAAVDAVEKLREWTKGLHNSNMVFAEFSASMAAVQANQEMRDILLSQGKGEARAATADKLAEAMSSLNETLAPVENLLANLMNMAGAKLLTIVEILIKYGTNLDVIVSILSIIAGEDEDEPEEGEEATSGQKKRKLARSAVKGALFGPFGIALELYERYGRPKKFEE